MKPFELMWQISEKTAPGRPPAYTVAYVLKALELIEVGLGVGRQKLSRELTLGEGSIRTLVKRFKESLLIETSRGGMFLTDKGRILLDNIREQLVGLRIPDSKLTVGTQNYAVLVRGMASNVKKGIEQRDAAIIAGAKGATTLVSDGKKLIMPDSDLKIEAEIENILLSRLNPDNGDVIIIGTSLDPFMSEIGAKTAALNLLH